MDAVCTWDVPGADPFRRNGVVERAIAAYGYPDELARRIRRIEPDAVLVIKRDSLEVSRGKATDLRDMHFGKNRLCRGTVTRNAWSATHEELALIYCIESSCVAVPIVCGNISRITWTPPPPRKEPEFRWWEGVPRDAPPRPLPLPGTTWLVVAALCATAITRKLKK